MHAGVSGIWGFETLGSAVGELVTVSLNSWFTNETLCSAFNIQLDVEEGFVRQIVEEVEQIVSDAALYIATAGLLYLLKTIANGLSRNS